MVSNLTVKIGADIEGLKKELSQATNQLGAFGKQMNAMGGMLAAAFGIQQVASFAFEVSKLAGEADSVNKAFSRLPNSVRLLEEMRTATGGTVAELDLMKRAVQASNFDISLEALPKLLEFATLRAQQTGQSVDYLVDSIVTGIGRKSKLILDNLGISAVALDQKLNGVSVAAASVGQVAEAVGEIAAEGLGSMAKFSENAATKTQRLAAEWTNFKVELGEGSANIGLMNDGIDTLTNLLKNLTAFLGSGEAQVMFEWLRLISLVPRSTLEAVNSILEYRNEQNTLNAAIDDFNKKFGKSPFAGVISDTKEFQDAVADLGAKAEKEGKKVLILRDDFGKTVAVLKPFTNTVVTLNDETEESIKTYSDLKAELDDLNKQFETATSRNDLKALGLIGDKIKAINAQIAALDKLRKTEKEQKDPKFQFIPDLEAEGSLNPDLRNDQAANDAKEFAKALDAVATSAEFAGGAMVTLNDNTVEAMDKMIDVVPLLQSAVAGAITDLASSLGRAAAGVESFGDSILEAVGSFAQQFGAALIAAGVAAAVAQSQLLTNPYAAIAAGAVLVGVGAALAATASSAHKEMFSGGGSAGGGSGGSRSGGLGTDGLEIRVVGETRIQGNDLWIILNRQNEINGRTRG